MDDPNNNNSQQDPPGRHHHQLHAGGGGSTNTSLVSPSSPLIPKDGPPPGALKQMPDDPAQAAMYKLLGARLRCTLTDGRTATGTFICMDRLKNMIMMDVLEERVIDPSNYDPTFNKSNTTTKPRLVPVQRELSQAMIPGKHLIKVEIDKETFAKHK